MCSKGAQSNEDVLNRYGNRKMDSETDKSITQAEQSPVFRRVSPRCRRLVLWVNIKIPQVWAALKGPYPKGKNPYSLKNP